MSGWSNEFLGIPWSAADDGRSGTHCWGLVRLVYREILSLDVGDYGPAPDRLVTASLLKTELVRHPWVSLPGVTHGQPFDLIVMQRGGIDDHVGVAVDRRLMLHVMAGSEARIDSMDDPRWLRRIVSIHRHRALAGAA